MSQVRVGEKTHELLRLLSSQEEKTMQEIIECAVEDYRRKQFMLGLNENFQALRDDAKAQAEYESEIEIWDATLLDGLEDA